MIEWEDGDSRATVETGSYCAHSGDGDPDNLWQKIHDRVAWEGHK